MEFIGSSHLLQAHKTKEGRGVQGVDMLKVQDQKAQFVPCRIFHTHVHLAHQALRGAEEDESLKAKDEDAVASLLDQLKLFKGTFHVALIGFARQRILDYTNATVIHDEEDDRNGDPCADTFEKTHRAHDNQDHPNKGIVNTWQLEPGIVQPFHQK